MYQLLELDQVLNPEGEVSTSQFLMLNAQLGSGSEKPSPGVSSSPSSSPKGKSNPFSKNASSSLHGSSSLSVKRSTSSGYGFGNKRDAKKAIGDMTGMLKESMM